MKIHDSKFLNRRFGRLTVIEKSERRDANGASYWVCLCDCGTVNVVVRAGSLRSGNTLSCGCEHRRRSSFANSKHCMTKHPIYRIWRGMIQRCFDRNRPNWKYYGGRGITVCKRWLDFETFYSDMADLWFPNASIERVNVNGNYEPNNCDWIPKWKQAVNRRTTRVFELNGERKTLPEWSKILGIPIDTLAWRIYQKRMPFSRAAERRYL